MLNIEGKKTSSFPPPADWIFNIQNRENFQGPDLWCFISGSRGGLPYFRLFLADLNIPQSEI